MSRVRKYRKAKRTPPPPRQRRPDHPVLRPCTRGALRSACDIVADAKHREKAVLSLRQAYYAASSVAPRDSLLKTYIKIADRAGITPFPLSRYGCETVFGAMFEVGYRSIPNYISRVRQRSMELDLPIADSVVLCLKNIERASVRGLGPARKSAALSLAVLQRASDRPPRDCSDSAPRDLRRCGVIAVWWMLREIEASALKLDRDQISFNRKKKTVTLNLPVSKNDPAGRGRKRTHGCLCGVHGSSLSSRSCPYHVLLDQVHDRCVEIGDFDRASPAVRSQPLFPAVNGGVFSKRGFIKAVNDLVIRYETKEETEERGADALTGHCARRGGAIFLTSCGVPLYAVQMLGRWGSDAVRGYIDAATVAWTQSISSLVAGACVGRDAQLTLLEVSTGAKCTTRDTDVSGVVQVALGSLRAELEDLRSALTKCCGTGMSEFVTDLRTGLVHRREPAAPTSQTACGMSTSGVYARFRAGPEGPPSHLVCPECYSLDDQ